MIPQTGRNSPLCHFLNHSKRQWVCSSSRAPPASCAPFQASPFFGTYLNHLLLPDKILRFNSGTGSEGVNRSNITLNKGSRPSTLPAGTNPIRLCPFPIIHLWEQILNLNALHGPSVQPESFGSNVKWFYQNILWLHTSHKGSFWHKDFILQ